MLLAARRGDRGNDARLRPEGAGIAAQQRVMRGGTVDTELRGHLVVPLADKRGRRQDQDPLSHAAQDVFLQHHPRFDGLAKTDLVGEQNAAAVLLEDLADGFNLIPVRLHAVQHRQAEQLIETLEQAQADELAAQVECYRIGLHLRRCDGIDVTEVERHVEMRRELRQIVDHRQRRNNWGGTRLSRGTGRR